MLRGTLPSSLVALLALHCGGAETLPTPLPEVRRVAPEGAPPAAPAGSSAASEQAAGEGTPATPAAPPSPADCPEPAPPAEASCEGAARSSPFVPVPRALAFGVVPGPNDRVRVCGPVVEVRPPAPPDIWTTVVIAGQGPERERSLRISTPDNAPLPFGIGDVISASIVSSRFGSSSTYRLLITDGAGRVLAGVRWAPGWTFEIGPVRRRGRIGGAELREHAVILGYQGRTVRIEPGNGWQRVEMCDGEWLVTGGATSLGRGTPPRDAGPSQSFMVYRLMPGQ